MRKKLLAILLILSVLLTACGYVVVEDKDRITIGSALGFSASAEEFDSIAAGAGFSESLTGAITGEDGYEVRFFFLDALGRLENLLGRK